MHLALRRFCQQTLLEIHPSLPTLIAEAFFLEECQHEDDVTYS